MFGKHTDYAGGHSLLAAVPRGIALSARPRTDGIVRVGDIFDGQVIEVDPSTEAPAHYRGIQRYVHVVAHRFHVNFPGCDLGANIAIASDLPRASGMSSSSALTVGIALALIKRAGLRERPEWQTSFAAHARPRVVPGVCRERAGLSGTPGIGRRRHARRQRGSHGDSCLPDRSRQPLPLRAGHAARRHAHAGGLDVRDCLERCPGRQGRLGEGSLQPRVERRARAARDLEPRVGRTRAVARGRVGEQPARRDAARKMDPWRRDVQRRRSAPAAAAFHERDRARAARRRRVSKRRSAGAGRSRRGVATRSARAARQPDSRRPSRSPRWRARSARSRRAASAPDLAAACGPPCRSPTRSGLAKPGCAPTPSACRTSAWWIGSSRGPGPPPPRYRSESL